MILFCQHSVATEYDQAAEQVRPALDVLKTLAKEGCQVVITYPNNDAGGRQIIAEIEKLRGEVNIVITRSLGRYRFHGVLNVIGHVGRGALVGNSSAGIKESRVFGCPAVNIGSRQQGRLRADNVLDTPYNREAILAAIRRCVADESFRRYCHVCENPYGAGNTGHEIAEILATIPIDRVLLQKKMTY